MGVSLRRAIPIIVFLLVAIVLMIVVRVSPFHLIDDSYITFRYAENFAAGHGLVFNIGERVEGYSSTLFLLLLAGWTKLAGWTPTGALILGPLAQAALVALLLAFLLRFVTERLARPLPLFALIFLIVHPSVIGYAESGMETTLAAFLLLVVVYLAAVTAERENPAALAAITGLATVTAALTRPEMIAQAAPIVAWLALGRKQKRLAAVAPYLIVVAAGYGAFLLWRHAYFGQWQPNTYYAKTAGAGLSLVPHGLAYLFSYANTTLVPYLAAIVVAAVVKLRARPPLWWWGVLGMAATHVAAIVYVGGDHFPLGRFFVPLTPLLLLLLVQGARSARDQANAANPNLAGTRLNAAVWVALALLLPSSIGLAMFYRNEGVNFMRNGAQALGWCEIGKKVAAVAPEGASVALIPIGAFGYCSQMRIVDLVGLTDETIAHTKTDLTLSAPGHGRYNNEYVVSEKKPDFVLLQIMLSPVPAPEWAVERGIVHLAAKDLIQQPRFSSDYAFHRMTFPAGFLHYWSRKDFENEAVNSGAYPVEGLPEQFPVQEPPRSISRTQYLDEETKGAKEFEVPEGWEVW
jgi:arabinofuranosyltransferase